MDVVYDNLENFTEEATNAELREENKNLKIKLEEYTTALEQLQKEFDTLLVEHKKLELNYSSLLRTARSEIERKTKAITKLNIEKDALVLNSIQNRNTPYNRRNPSTNEAKNKEGPTFRNASQMQYNIDNHIKPSHLNQVPNERREQNYGMSADFNNVHRNMHTRHLDTVNKSVVNPNINTARENEVKENVTVKDEHSSRARITNRRKSMPVLGMDSKFSSDEDEVASNGSSKKFVPQEQLQNKYPEKPSMERKVFVHHDYKPETRSRHYKYDSFKHRNREDQKHKRNQSSHRRRSPDRIKASPERRRVSSDRKKASPERRRSSPEKRKASQDRNRKDVHDYSAEFYKRLEHDRHKGLASPPEDKYHDYRHKSRDSQHFNKRQVEFEKYKSRSQDKYMTKHKMMHDYEEPSNKRMRVDSYPKYEEDRWREKQAPPASFEIDSLHMSCQSPDQNYFEAHPSHQTREIKLTASTLLDDPRLTSKKYALKNQDGITKLSTVDSANIDVKVIDTSGWEIIQTVKIPDALLTKPINPDLPSESLLQRPMTSGNSSTSLQKPMFSDTSDTSLLKLKSEIPQVFIHKPASSNLSDVVPSDTTETLLQKVPKIPNNQLLTDSISIYESKSTDMPDLLTQKPITGDESIPDSSPQKPMSNDDLVKEIYMDIENPCSNMSMETVSDANDFDNGFNNSGENTKPQDLIRKDEVELSNVKTVSKKPSNSKISKKSIVSSDECNNQKPNPKRKNKNTESKTTDKTNKKPSEDLTLNESKLPPKRRSSDFQNYISAKEIIAGDLELSDENSDNTDMPIIKQNPISKDQQDIEMKDDLGSNKKDKSKTFELKIDFDEANIEEKTDDIMLDIRKSKSKKKSLKLKETKELHGNKDTLISIDKLVKKTEATQELCENADTSLSIDQLVKIKEDITKELADKAIPLDKPIKKKDNKIKALSKSKEAALTIDKTVKKKEIQPKGLIESKDTEKPGPAKNKSKEQPEKKEKVIVEKTLKKKDITTKQTVEPTSAIPINKSAKNKCNIQELSSNIEKEITNKAVVKKDDDYKTKNNKFNELFGDSSSLVSPEDLGLVPTVVAPPENYIAMFEDAQDALDMNSIRASITTASTKNTNDTEGKAQSNFSDNKKPIPVEPTYQQIQGPAQAEPVSNSSINQTMYQNLQPGFSQQDSNIVKTVIISSGIQPQCTLEATETYPIMSDNKELHVMQCVKPSVLQDIALQALATSTPQKIWHQNVQAVEPISVTRCESREGSITETPLAATSGTSTNVRHTNAADEPDVTIFVKRRRKVLRKK